MKKFIVFLILFSAIYFLFSSSVFAQGGELGDSCFFGVQCASNLICFQGVCAYPSQQNQQQPDYSLPPLPRGFGPRGEGVDVGIISSLLIILANFLIGIGITIAIIVIVWSGIMYFRAGSDTKAEAAKGWFKNGIIGAFIILGVGVIIWTVYGLVTGDFFTIDPFPGGPFPGF